MIKNLNLIPANAKISLVSTIPYQYIRSKSLKSNDNLFFNFYLCELCVWSGKKKKLLQGQLRMPAPQEEEKE